MTEQEQKQSIALLLAIGLDGSDCEKKTLQDAAKGFLAKLYPAEVAEAAGLPIDFAPGLKNVPAMDALGNVAYVAYCDSRQWKSFVGTPLPPFEGQSLDLQEAWSKAALAVVAAIVPSAWTLAP